MSEMSEETRPAARGGADREASHDGRAAIAVGILTAALIALIISRIV